MVVPGVILVGCGRGAVALAQLDDEPRLASGEAALALQQYPSSFVSWLVRVLAVQRRNLINERMDGARISDGLLASI